MKLKGDGLNLEKRIYSRLAYRRSISLLFSRDSMVFLHAQFFFYYRFFFQTFRAISSRDDEKSRLGRITLQRRATPFRYVDFRVPRIKGRARGRRKKRDRALLI